MGPLPRLLLRRRLPRRLYLDLDGPLRPSREQPVLPLPRAGTEQARAPRTSREDAGSAGYSVRPGALRPHHRTAGWERRTALGRRSARLGDEGAATPRRRSAAAEARPLLRLHAV